MRERHKAKKFTQDEIKLLESNPFTRNVTEYKIFFTLEFKNLFLSKYEQGLSVIAIFEELGYNPEILGRNRMYCFSDRLLHQIEAGKPLTEVPAGSKIPAPANTDYNTMPAQQSVASMQRELAYLRQQVEFLKKISQLDKTEK